MINPVQIPQPFKAKVKFRTPRGRGKFIELSSLSADNKDERDVRSSQLFMETSFAHWWRPVTDCSEASLSVLVVTLFCFRKGNIFNARV